MTHRRGRSKHSNQSKTTSDSKPRRRAASSAPDKGRKRPTREQLEAAYGKTVPDVIGPGLSVLFVGINPSLYTAAVGLHFGRPGNRFWPALQRAGIIDHLLEPGEQRQLLAKGFGITNIVPQATARADELSHEQLVAGAKRLQRTVRRYQPRLVVFLGLTAYRAAFDRKSAEIGRQSQRLAGAEIWLLPNPSGLNAHYQLDDFVRFFKRVKRYAAADGRRARRPR